MNKTKQQVLVVHGGDSFKSKREFLKFLDSWRIDIEGYRHPKSGWKSGLRAALGPNFEVISLDMPNKMDAKYTEWKIWFEKFIPFFAGKPIFIGHSLGALFIAKYLSENRLPKPASAVFLIAPPFGEGDFPLKNNLSGLAGQSENIFLYQSEDDPVVDIRNHYKFLSALPDAKARLFKKKGHFNQSTFLELVRDIRKIKKTG